MAAKDRVFLTGDLDVDSRLAKLEKKLIRKLLPKAAKKAGKVVQDDYRTRVPVATGALQSAVAVKVRRYKHKKNTGRTGTRDGKTYAIRRIVAEDIGARVLIERNRLTKAANTKRRSKKRGGSIPWDRKRGGMFFYAAIVELGGRSRNGNRSLTKALYKNPVAIRRVFLAALTDLIRGITK